MKDFYSHHTVVHKWANATGADKRYKKTGDMIAGAPTLVIKKKIRYNKGITPAEKHTDIGSGGEQKPASRMQADFCIKSKGSYD